MTSCGRTLLVLICLSPGCAPKPRKTEPPVPASPPLPSEPAPDEKAARVVLTPAAAAEVQRAIKGNPKAQYLRLSLEGKLGLFLDEETNPRDDYSVESRGVQVVADRKTAAALPPGIVVDFEDEGGSRGFRFRSPWVIQPLDTKVSLADARRGFQTILTPRAGERTPAPDPPRDIFRVVRYDAPPGQLVAYLTPDPGDGKKRPAIIWITGADCNTIDQGCWREGSDQSAAAYRRAGMVMMFPSQRGGNDNPGFREGFFGEVDDVLAAAAFLRRQPYIDPDRIYLGGHSTGGTLALLTAECSDAFRAVFAFGPTDDVMGYGFGDYAFSYAEPKELALRSPARWLHSVKVPVFVIEGESDARSLRTMAAAGKNPKVRLFTIRGANHFNVLGRSNKLIAERIRGDTGPTCELELTAEELHERFEKSDR